MTDTYPPSTAPRFLVDIAGTEFHEYSGYITDVIVDTTIDGADHFSLRLVYPFDHEQVEFDELDWSQFELGTEVEIHMGYGEGSGSTEQVFTGAIETIEPEFPIDGPPSVTISGYCPLYTMMSGTVSQSWEETEIGSIVDEIASGFLEDITVEDADVELERVYQNDQSPYRFILQLANRYGFEFFSSLGEGYFRPEDGGNSPDDPVATLYYGESLEGFSAVWSTPDVGEIEVRYWDESAKEEIVGSASGGDGTERAVYRIPVESETEAETIAEGLLDDEDEIEVVGETFGIPSILAGTMIELDGLGPNFNKDYYVTGATHRIGGDGYQMTFEAVTP